MFWSDKTRRQCHSHYVRLRDFLYFATWLSALSRTGRTMPRPRRTSVTQSRERINDKKDQKSIRQGKQHANTTPNSIIFKSSICLLSSVVLHSFNFGVHGLSKPTSRPVLPHLHSHIDTANTWTTWRSLSLPASKAHQSPNLKDCVAKNGNDALKAIWLEKNIKHDADLVHI